MDNFLPNQVDYVLKIPQLQKSFHSKSTRYTSNTVKRQSEKDDSQHHTYAYAPKKAVTHKARLLGALRKKTTRQKKPQLHNRNGFIVQRYQVHQVRYGTSKPLCKQKRKNRVEEGSSLCKQLVQLFPLKQKRKGKQRKQQRQKEKENAKQTRNNRHYRNESKLNQGKTIEATT